MRTLVFLLFLGLAFVTNLLQAQSTSKQWAFVNNKTGYAKILKQNQKITVRWSDKKGTYILWGPLIDISEDSLHLKYNKRNTAIAKNDITKIKYKRKRNFGESSRGIALTLVGIVLMHIVLQRSEEVYEDTEVRLLAIGAFLGLILIIWGLVLLKSPRERISHPFGGSWFVQEIPVVKNNRP